MKMYCVAPIIAASDQPLPATYDLWAAGTDCCSDGGSNFTCGASRSSGARGGLRLLSREEDYNFRLAVEDAEFMYHLRSVHPLFFEWTVDPIKEITARKDEAFWVYFATNLMLLGLTYGLERQCHYELSGMASPRGLLIATQVSSLCLLSGGHGLCLFPAPCKALSQHDLRRSRAGRKEKVERNCYSVPFEAGYSVQNLTTGWRRHWPVVICMARSVRPWSKPVLRMTVTASTDIPCELQELVDSEEVELSQWEDWC